jgi:hypothetical protein
MFSYSSMIPGTQERYRNRYSFYGPSAAWPFAGRGKPASGGGRANVKNGGFAAPRPSIASDEFLLKLPMVFQ